MRQLGVFQDSSGTIHMRQLGIFQDSGDMRRKLWDEYAGDGTEVTPLFPPFSSVELC